MAASFSAEQKPLLKIRTKSDFKIQFLSCQMKKTAEASAVFSVLCGFLVALGLSAVHPSATRTKSRFLHLNEVAPFDYIFNIHSASIRVSGRDSTDKSDVVPTITEEYPESSPCVSDIIVTAAALGSAAAAVANTA